MRKIIFLSALVLLFASVTVRCQSNVEVRPDRDIKIGWESGGVDVQEYAIFWVQGADTTQFPFNNGTDPYDLWMNEPIHNWSFARVYDLEYSYIVKQMTGVTYVRLGVAGINRHTGQMGLIATLPYVIKIERPDSIQGIQVIK